MRGGGGQGHNLVCQELALPYPAAAVIQEYQCAGEMSVEQLLCARTLLCRKRD